ncbi:MAG: 2OG-Fe(II) oxygenase [Allosphingosinicella sp.]
MPVMPPSTCDRAGELVAVRRFAEAYRLLASEEAARDPDALFVLANWRLTGQIVRRDLAASRDLFRRAAEAGQDQAASIHIAFLAQGVGGDADWPAALDLLHRRAATDPGARRQLALIDAMRLTATGDPVDAPRPESLSEQPAVARVEALFTPEECEFLIAEAEPQLAPSLVIDPQTGRHVRNPIRTSDAMAFTYTAENPAIHALNRRIANVTGTAAAQGEPLQVLRYRGGQEYRPHVDAVAGDPNQRILTALVYLSDGYKGGETMFISTGLKFRGGRGDALIFRNAFDDGRADPMAQHAGLPVTAGAKIIASRWIRARPFALAPPPPLLDV